MVLVLKSIMIHKVCELDYEGPEGLQAGRHFKDSANGCSRVSHLDRKTECRWTSKKMDRRPGTRRGNALEADAEERLVWRTLMEA